MLEPFTPALDEAGGRPTNAYLRDFLAQKCDSPAARKKAGSELVTFVNCFSKKAHWLDLYVPQLQKSKPRFVMPRQLIEKLTQYVETRLADFEPIEASIPYFDNQAVDRLVKYLCKYCLLATL